MAATGNVYIEDPTTALLSYTSIRVYRGSTSDPNTAVFTALVQTLTLVAGTENYAFTDGSGTVDTIWRAWFYNTSSTAHSNLGPIIRPDQATTLRKVRIEAARQAGAGFDSTCSAAGTASPATLIDAGLRDSGIDSAFLEGAWIYRPDAAAAGDKVRRVAKDGYDSATGTLSFDRIYTNLPASAEVYQVFNLAPPVDQPGVSYSWDRAVREGLNMAWFIDQVNLGEGTSTRQTRFSLANFPDITARTIRRVLLRTTDTNSIITDINASTNGRYWVPVTNAGAFQIDIYPAPATTQTVIVEAVRTDSDIYIDTDWTNTPIDLAVRAAVVKIYNRLTMLQPGRYAAELAVALSDYNEEQSRYGADGVVLGV